MRTLSLARRFGMNCRQIRSSRSMVCSGYWKVAGNLVIVSKVVGELGPRDAYLKMAEVVRLVPTDSFSSQLLRIKLISPKSLFMRRYAQYSRRLHQSRGTARWFPSRRGLR